MQERHGGEWHRIYKLNRCRERNKMDFLKDLFPQPLSFEEFVKAVESKGYKLADLSKGEYVAKGKLDDALAKNKTLTKDITELQNSNASTEDFKKKFEDLQKKIEDDEKAAKAAADDKALTDAITAVFGDKKFTSDYVRNGIIADMKTEIAKAENKGKGYAEIFESLTKDKEGIFANPNGPANMTGMNDKDPDITDNTAREVMGLPPLNK